MKKQIEQLKQVKFSLNKETYDKPTPKIMRRIGDGILLAGSILTTVSCFFPYPVVPATAAVLTLLGKYITNFTE